MTTYTKCTTALLRSGSALKEYSVIQTYLIRKANRCTNKGTRRKEMLSANFDDFVKMNYNCEYRLPMFPGENEYSNLVSAESLGHGDAEHILTDQPIIRQNGVHENGTLANIPSLGVVDEEHILNEEPVIENLAHQMVMSRSQPNANVHQTPCRASSRYTELPWDTMHSSQDNCHL